MTKLSDIDIDLLVTIDALLLDLNITHAAARLGISQPAMSARLARLKALFGEPLFIPSPHGRGVLPTPGPWHSSRWLARCCAEYPP